MSGKQPRAAAGSDQMGSFGKRPPHLSTWPNCGANPCDRSGLLGSQLGRWQGNMDQNGEQCDESLVSYHNFN